MRKSNGECQIIAITHQNGKEDKIKTKLKQ